jgi:anti-anti-sigma factor
VSASAPVRDDAPRDPISVDLDPVRTQGYAAIVALCGEHDASTSDGIGAAFARVNGNLLVDLSECDFIDSTVIGRLLEKYEDLRREGHRLELVVPPGKLNVRRVIEVIGLRTLITVHDAMPGVADPELPDGPINSA